MNQETIIHPTTYAEANSIAVDLDGFGVRFVLQYNAGGFTLRLLSYLDPRLMSQLVSHATS